MIIKPKILAIHVLSAMLGFNRLGSKLHIPGWIELSCFIQKSSSSLAWAFHNRSLETVDQRCAVVASLLIRYGRKFGRITRVGHLASPDELIVVSLP